MNEHQKDMCSTYVTHFRVNSHKGQYFTQLGGRMLSIEEKKDVGFDPLQILLLKRQFWKFKWRSAWF